MTELKIQNEETYSKESSEENELNETEKLNSCDFDLFDVTYDSESDNSIELLSLDSSEEGSDNYRDDCSFSVLNSSIKDMMHESDDSSSLENQNINYTCIHNITEDSSNLVITELKIQNKESYSEEFLEKNMNKLEINVMSKSTKGINESETTHPYECQSQSSPKLLHQNLRRISYHDFDSDYLNKTENSRKISEILANENNANENETEIQFKDLVNELILEYNTNMEIKLKDQVLDFDRDLKETHKTLKYNILETYENKSNDLKLSFRAYDYRLKYYRELNNKIKEAIKIYKNIVEVKLIEARNQYENILLQISVLYKMDMKSAIIDQIRDDLYIKDLSHIQSLCKEKAFSNFKEETVKLSKGNIETEFLSKLNEEMSQINYNFNALLDYFKAYESGRQQIFLKLKYYSEGQIKEFHENQKTRINDLMQKFRDPDLIQFTFSILEKSYNAFKERNKLIKEKENFAVRALERKSYEYPEKYSETEKKLTKAREEALKSFCHSMNTKLITSEKNIYMNSNEFTELHHRYSRMAIENFNHSAQFLLQDFEPEVANKILLENQSLLRKLIANEKQMFKILNHENTPDVHTMAIYLGKQYITTATHCNKRYEIICDKFGQKLRPNSISVGDEILIGSEAKNHYENFYPDIISFKNFDIKQLLGRERSHVLNEELSTFPFTFSRDKLYVCINYHDLKTDLSIESLLALMILDIKSCAEKQIGNIMSNIVLAVPTNYTINQKNAIRNAAKIAGFEDCYTIREISAAAISYAAGKLSFYSKFNDTVLFVIINDYECDVAICEITKNKIVYKKYYHQTLNSTEEEKRNFFHKIIKNTRKNENYNNNITKLKFKKLMDHVFKRAIIELYQIDECIIAGNSTLIPEIKIWINKYINPIPVMKCDSLDIIMKGSALYAEMLANKIDLIRISEVTTHNIYLSFDIKSSKEKIIEVMHRNTPLPTRKCIPFDSPKSSDLPLTITVSQDNQTVITHLINVLPLSDYCYKYLINFDVDCFGQIYIVSVLSNRNHTSRIKLESIEINSGLNYKDLGEEKQKLCSLINKIRGDIMMNDEKLCLRKAINELRSYCSRVKNEVENNLKLRPLIKKQILLELENTLSFLNCEHLDLNDISKQKLMLDKTLDGYMQ